LDYLSKKLSDFELTTLNFSIAFVRLRKRIQNAFFDEHGEFADPVEFINPVKVWRSADSFHQTLSDLFNTPSPRPTPIEQSGCFCRKKNPKYMELQRVIVYLG
jgi:hypothetical protein